jgi:hypothetical protein
MSEKRRYTKPEVEKVELVVQETVLTFCKGGGDQGPLIGSCQQPGGPGPCQVKGT